jgi:hypothetical protein
MKLEYKASVYTISQIQVSVRWHSYNQACSDGANLSEDRLYAVHSFKFQSVFELIMSFDRLKRQLLTLSTF